MISHCVVIYIDKHTFVFSLSLSLSLSVPLYFEGFFFFSRLWLFFYSSFLSFFGVGIPAYFSNHCPFLREHNFVGFKKFTSLMCWCTVIHHQQPQGPTHFFKKVKWDFTMQCYVCSDTGPSI